jgi:hypothetical protein
MAGVCSREGAGRGMCCARVSARTDVGGAGGVAPALPGFAFDVHVSLMELDELERECKPDTRALNRARLRVRDAVELVPDALSFCLWDAEPGVGDAKDEVSRLEARRDLHKAFLRVLDRLREGFSTGGNSLGRRAYIAE